MDAIQSGLSGSNGCCVTRISFLVPTYNRAAYLGVALTAIISQMNADDELLVIDDGSTDETPEVATAFARVRYIRQENAGKSAALNRGLAETDGEFVWICDDDDILRPDVVEPLLKSLVSSDAGWVFARYTRFCDRPGGGREDLGTGYWPNLEEGMPVRHILEDGFVMQNAALVRRSVYRAVGPFSERLPRSIDYEMFIRLAVTEPCVALNDIVFDQRKHAGIRGPSSARHSAVSSEKVWRKYDQLIFQHAYDHLPLDFYARFFAGPERLRQRAGLLQRAVIMARHDCVEHALMDFSKAAVTDPEMPFDAEELRICGRAMAGKNAIAGSDGDLLARGLRQLSRSSKQGGRIVEAVLAGARWRLRRGSFTQRWHALRQATIAGGIGRTVRAALTGPSAVGTLQELRALPRAAYLSRNVLPVFGGL